MDSFFVDFERCIGLTEFTALITGKPVILLVLVDTFDVSSEVGWRKTLSTERANHSFIVVFLVYMSCQRLLSGESCTTKRAMKAVTMLTGDVLSLLLSRGEGQQTDLAAWHCCCALLVRAVARVWLAATS